MKTMVVAKRVIQQIKNDKRTIALMMVAPLLILSLIYFLFDGNTVKQNVGVYNVKNEIVLDFKEQDTHVIIYDDNLDVESKILDDNLVAFIDYDKDTYHVTYKNLDVSQTSAIKIMLQISILKYSTEDALSNIKTKVAQFAPQIDLSGSSENQPQVENDYLFLDDDTTFYDTISPIFVGFFVFFFVFLISGISIINERKSGTLEKMLSTPIKRSNIVFGYLIGYGFFAIIQTVIVVMFSIYILNTPMYGNIFLVILVNILIALIALSLGILLSSFAKTEFQMMQFIPLVVVPQIFFSGIIDINGMADWLQTLAKVFPLYYGSEALREIMLMGQGFNDIVSLILILLAFIVVFTVLNILSLKKYRKV